MLAAPEGGRCNGSPCNDIDGRGTAVPSRSACGRYHHARLGGVRLSLQLSARVGLSEWARFALIGVVVHVYDCRWLT
ncbi:hypothetical protein GCM10027569_86580 [Flindersiella endophytica]